MTLFEAYKLEKAKRENPIVYVPKDNRYVCNSTVCKTYQRGEHHQFLSASLDPKNFGCKCWECKPENEGEIL